MPSFLFDFMLCGLEREETPEIISKLNKLNLSKEYLESMNYFEKCELLNNNAALRARHFQHHVEAFFKGILLMPFSSIGKVTYYAIRIESQERGSSHVHSFNWILNPPKVSEEALGTWIEFIDNTIHANLPAPDDDPAL